MSALAHLLEHKNNRRASLLTNENREPNRHARDDTHGQLGQRLAITSSQYRNLSSSAFRPNFPRHSFSGRNEVLSARRLSAQPLNRQNLNVKHSRQLTVALARTHELETALNELKHQHEVTLGKEARTNGEALLSYARHSEVLAAEMQTKRDEITQLKKELASTRISRTMNQKKVERLKLEVTRLQGQTETRENPSCRRDNLIDKLDRARGQRVDLLKHQQQADAWAVEKASMLATIRDLDRRLDRERRRREEIEAKLGPDGRRCKKCNPVVVSLLDDSSIL